jgi:hypothetical protein
MPKLDPDDVDQPTAADAAAASQSNAVNPATITAAPAAATASKPAPSLFGGAPSATTNSSFGGAPAFGSSSTGFGSQSNGFGASTSGGFNSGSSFGGQQSQFGGQQSQFGGSQGQNQAIDTSAFSSAIVASEGRPEEHWMKSFWRPAMGWLYMFTCLCDFVVFPVLWSVMQALIHGAVQQQWNPITLQGAGLYHLAMGAVLGVAAYGRSKEKTEGVK